MLLLSYFKSGILLFYVYVLYHSYVFFHFLISFSRFLYPEFIEKQLGMLIYLFNKSFCSLTQALSFWSCQVACGILVTQPEIKSVPLQWKLRDLTTGYPGKSLTLYIHIFN